MEARADLAKEIGWMENSSSEENKMERQRVPLFEYNTRINYISQEDEDIEDLEAKELEAKADLIERKNNKTKFTPISPDMDSDNIKEDDITDADENEMESLSVVWYLGAFGGLVTFFLIIVCSEFCFGNAMYRRHNPNEYINRVNVYADAYFPQTPPPPYHLFAPPTYTDTLQRKFNNGKLSIEKNDTFKKESLDNSQIFIVPVHQSKMPYPPPSYTA